MSESKTTNENLHDKSFNNLIDWFNRWLENPITTREKVLIGETIDYLATNKVRRYDPEKFSGDINVMRQNEVRKIADD